MAHIEGYDWHSMTFNLPDIMESMMKERAKELGLDKSTYLRRLIAEDIKTSSKNGQHLKNIQEIEDERRWLVPKNKRSIYERYGSNEGL